MTKRQSGIADLLIDLHETKKLKVASSSPAGQAGLPSRIILRVAMFSSGDVVRRLRCVNRDFNKLLNDARFIAQWYLTHHRGNALRLALLKGVSDPEFYALILKSPTCVHFHELDSQTVSYFVAMAERPEKTDIARVMAKFQFGAIDLDLSLKRLLNGSDDRGIAEKANDFLVKWKAFPWLTRAFVVLSLAACLFEQTVSLAEFKSLLRKVKVLFPRLTSLLLREVATVYILNPFEKTQEFTASEKIRALLSEAYSYMTPSEQTDTWLYFHVRLPNCTAFLRTNEMMAGIHKLAPFFIEKYLHEKHFTYKIMKNVLTAVSKCEQSDSFATGALQCLSQLHASSFELSYTLEFFVEVLPFAQSERSTEYAEKILRGLLLGVLCNSVSVLKHLDIIKKLPNIFKSKVMLSALEICDDASTFVDILDICLHEAINAKETCLKRLHDDNDFICSIFQQSSKERVNERLLEWGINY